MARRGAVGLAVSFFKAEFGMKGFEVLARASACHVSDGRRHGLLGCLHVVHPFRYPQYFSPDKDETAWVHEVGPDDLRLHAQVRDDAGNTVDEVELSHEVQPHPRADLVALRFADEDAGREFLKRHEVETHVLPAVEDGDRSEPGLPLWVDGHRTEARMEDNQDTSLLVPQRVQGRLEFAGETQQRGQGGALFRGQQLFASTAVTLDYGMCGAPALCESTGRLVGLVDGILTPEMVRDMGLEAQMASIAPAALLGDLL